MKWTRRKTEMAWALKEEAINLSGAQDFVHPADMMEPEDGGFEVGQALVLRILEWISRGPDVQAWGVRAWVACYHLRPALCRPNTMTKFAKERGVSQQAVVYQVNSFRAEFKEVDWPSFKSRNGGQRRHDDNSPRGKESLPGSSL